MAQASTAQQREPSMEEILASIRRIIEDSETGRKDEAPRDHETAFRSLADLEGFRSLAPSAVAPLSPESTYEPAQDQSEWTEETSQPNNESAAPEGFESDADEEEDFPIPVAANAQMPPAEGQGAPQGYQQQAVNPALHPQSAELERRPIISRLPGRKVAAAFEELNEALIANRRKTLDQMAEEMLQPMLQDWLDNNLPQLVERLVREEIERIARGI